MTRKARPRRDQSTIKSYLVGREDAHLGCQSACLLRSSISAPGQMRITGCRRGRDVTRTICRPTGETFEHLSEQDRGPPSELGASRSSRSELGAKET